MSSVDGLMGPTNTSLAELHLNATATNATRWPVNTTIPWDDAVLMGEVFQSWMQFQHLPPAKDCFMAFAWILHALTSLIVNYALWQVLSGIVLSEAPQATFSDQRDAIAEKKDDDVKVRVVVKHERQYSKNVLTVTRHLIHQAGLTSVLRGVACYLCTQSVTVLVTGLVGMGVFKLMGYTLEEIPLSHNSLLGFGINILFAWLSDILLPTWQAAHDHIVVTMPTFRVWTRRLPRYLPVLKAVWLPILITCSLQAITQDFPRWLQNTFHVANIVGPKTNIQILIRTLIWATKWLLHLTLSLPSATVVRRIYVSLLPEDEETIVPIDRSFGTNMAPGRSGYMPPGILAKPQGAITLKQAWQSLLLNSSYRHILVLYLQMVFIQWATMAVFWPVLGNAALPEWSWRPGPH